MILAAFFVMNAAALAYLPFVHDAVHAHEDHGSPAHDASSKDLCSAQNHLAANLTSDEAPKFEVFKLPETVSSRHETRHVFFTQSRAGSRAPPTSPVHP